MKYAVIPFLILSLFQPLRLYSQIKPVQFKMAEFLKILDAKNLEEIQAHPLILSNEVHQMNQYTYELIYKHETYGFRFLIKIDQANAVVTDLIARMPPYFLHDTFFWALQNKWGKQDLMHRQNEEAVYLWQKNDDYLVHYEALCTITCFPSFLRIEKKNRNQLSTLAQDMNLF